MDHTKVKSETEDETADLSLDALKNTLSHMVIKSHTKVLDDRVFSMAIHPDPTQTLVFAGSVSGHLAIWDPESEDGVEQKVNATVKKEDDDDDDDEKALVEVPRIKTGKFWRMNRYHSDSLSAIRIAPHNGHTVSKQDLLCFSLLLLTSSMNETTALYVFIRLYCQGNGFRFWQQYCHLRRKRLRRSSD